MATVVGEVQLEPRFGTCPPTELADSQVYHVTSLAGAPPESGAAVKIGKEASLYSRARSCCNSASCGSRRTVRPVPGYAARHWYRSGRSPQTSASE